MIPLIIFKKTLFTKSAGEYFANFSVAEKQSSVPDCDDHEVIFHVSFTIKQCEGWGVIVTGFEIVNPEESPIYPHHLSFITFLMKRIPDVFKTGDIHGDVMYYLDYGDLYRG